MEVRDPSGRTWRVERRLIRLPAWRGFGRPRLDPADGVVASTGDGGLADLAVGLLFVVLLALSVAFVWPVLVLGAELVAAILLLVVRLLLGRWTVVAETTGERRTWRVRGRAESARFAAHLAEMLRTGESPRDEDSFESTVVSGGAAGPPVPERTGHVRVIRR